MHPKPLYKDLLRELLPVGTERAKILTKIVFMGVFVYYVITITNVLGMDDDDESLLNLAKSVLTIVVVSIPSFLGKFQSSEVNRIKESHRKGIIEEEIERFLSQNDQFYNYKKGLKKLGVSVGEEEEKEEEEALVKKLRKMIMQLEACQCRCQKPASV